MNINFSAIKTKLFPVGAESKNVISLKNMAILDHIEKVFEISSRIGIEKSLIKGKVHLDYVAKKLGISPVQAVLFSHFLEKSDDGSINISEIAQSIKCSKVKLIKYMNEIEELEKRRLIRCSRESYGLRFRIPAEVNDSLRKNNEYIPEKKENLPIFKFFIVLEQIFDEKSKNELTYKAMEVELLDLIKLNMHLTFCQKIMSYNYGNFNLILLLCFCHLFVNINDDEIGLHDIDFLFDEKYTFSHIKETLHNGSNILIESLFIEFKNDDGFLNTESWKLTDKAKKELLFEIGKSKNYKKNLILSETIKPKKMYYNPREAGEIQKLISLLSNKNYKKIQGRLEKKGMRKGFACLFSGGPGTGKTETVYQIARKTKRSIMMVDISETKSCFYGESEKKIKGIFDTYRTAVEKSEITPILLFNEADAVIGSRREIDNSNPSISQTDNRIQNIILQEIENLPGILIATTNLVQNMDKAFERRFLYKINFDKPSVESRMGIWNSLLPDIDENTAAELSSRFKLSGGQIENIARKTEVDDILNGNNLSKEILVEYCKAETINDPNTTKRIGFTNE